jgi:outer membrane protein TolC
MRTIARPVSLGFAFAAAVLVARITSAQSPSPTPAPPAPPSSGEAAAPSPAPAEFRPPEVEDRWLAPVPAATLVLSSWTDALAHMRARSTDLKIALLEVVRAEGQARAALAAALPTITGTANATRNLLRSEVTSWDVSPLFASPPGQPVQSTTRIPSATTYGGTFTLTQPLLALRAWHQMGTAEQAIEAAKLSVEDKKRTIALVVANNIVTVVTTERVAEINRVGLRAALERLLLTKRRAALGAATALDVLRTEQDAAQARADIVSGDEALLKAREALGLSLGHGKPVGVTRRISLDELEAAARGTCVPMRRVDDRADLRLARKQVEIGGRGVEDVWLQFAPTVNLVSRTDLSSERLANNEKVAWSVAGVLTVPLWEGGARYGLLRDTAAQRDQAVQRLDAVRRTASIELEQARRAIVVTESARQVAEQARALARESERLARLAFELGKATSFELIDAGQKLRSAEINLAVKELGVVQARIAAYLALASCEW